MSPKSRKHDELSNTGALEQLGSNIRLIWDLLRDRREPFYLKLLPTFGILWLILPDFAPGPVDDTLALFFTSYLFIELSPPHLVEELRQKRVKRKKQQTEEEVVDADWTDMP